MIKALLTLSRGGLLVRDVVVVHVHGGGEAGAGIVVGAIFGALVGAFVRAQAATHALEVVSCELNV